MYPKEISPKAQRTQALSALIPASSDFPKIGDQDPFYIFIDQLEI